MMEIAMIAPFGMRPKGTVKVRMLPMARELVRLGHEVSIVIPPWTNPEDSGKREVIDGVNIENIRLPKGFGLLSYIVITNSLVRKALELKPDVIHCFKPKAYSGLAAMLLRFRQRMGWRFKLIIDTDDWEGRGGWNDFLDYSWPQKRLFQFQESWIPRHSDGVTVASRTLQTQVWGLGVRPDKAHYLPNGVSAAPPADGRSVRDRYGIGGRPVLLLYTRFFEFPLDKVVKVFDDVHRALPDTVFLVVGKGKFEEEERLKEIAGDRGFSSSLIVTGWLESQDIPSHIAAGDVAIYPFSDNLINRAKCPVKLTEILLQGKVVVADRVGQIAEYIKDGESGVLTEPEDIDGFSRAVITLLKDSEMRQRFENRVKERMVERFSWELLANRLSKFYLEA
jgi:glycosyltransferase involved in cell wall biosynthesis